ncbi:MAG TPA: hypothetical protein VNN77_03640, partial [candidate division Zixibacteria bacterium]|nr:hypothetical protein [candidate division Zixibacteria bacterium]
LRAWRSWREKGIEFIAQRREDRKEKPVSLVPAARSCRSSVPGLRSARGTSNPELGTSISAQRREDRQERTSVFRAVGRKRKSFLCALGGLGARTELNSSRKDAKIAKKDPVFHSCLRHVRAGLRSPVPGLRSAPGTSNPELGTIFVIRKFNWEPS